MARAAKPRLYLRPVAAPLAPAPAIPAARFSWLKLGGVAGVISFCAMTWAALFGVVSALL